MQAADALQRQARPALRQLEEAALDQPEQAEALDRDEGDGGQQRDRRSDRDPGRHRAVVPADRQQAEAGDGEQDLGDHLDRQVAIEDYWLARLELPRLCLRKSVVNVYSKYSLKKRTNKLPYGTCKLVVHRTRIVQTIFGSIQEYGGFERPEWLD